MINIKGNREITGLDGYLVDPEAKLHQAEKVCVDLVILGDMQAARRCAEIFALDFDDVVERHAEMITFARLKA